MAHGAWRMAHGAWRMAHGALHTIGTHACGRDRESLKNSDGISPDITPWPKARLRLGEAKTPGAEHRIRS
eukprot:6486015-Prymnesium_polylepis.1